MQNFTKNPIAHQAVSLMQRLTEVDQANKWMEKKKSTNFLLNTQMTLD
jgi:hypothetical protein